MLEMLSAERNVNRKYVAWVARFGRIFWNLVEVAVPRSIPSLVFQHWLKLLYFFEMLMITGGVLLVNQTVQQFGLIAFGVTAGLHVVVTVLAETMQSRTRWLQIARKLLIVLLAALLAAGMFAVVAVVYGGPTWDWLAAARSWIQNPESPGREFVPRAVLLGAVAFLVVVLRRDLRALV